MSHYSRKQLTNPVLTPSLNVVDQDELDELYLNDKEHHFLEKVGDAPSYSFHEMEEII